MALNIVLMQPEIPQNTGNIARTCAATGAVLHLVHPLGFTLADRYLKRAGLDYWPDVTLVQWESTEAFFRAHPADLCSFFTKKASRCYADVTYPEDCFLVFGRESVGLDEAILRSHPERTVRIPMREGERCLNLSNSVAVAVYEYERQRNWAGLAKSCPAPSGEEA